MIVMGMNGTRLPSLLVAFVVFMALSVVNLIAFHSMNERDWVKSRYEAVRTSSNLFASLRSHDDFGSAIEATQSLKGNILGFGLYDEAGSLLYRWGEAPDAYTQPAFDDAEVLQDQTRMYVETRIMIRSLSSWSRRTSLRRFRQTSRITVQSERLPSRSKRFARPI